MRVGHIVRRDQQAHSWDYALAGSMVAIAIVALVTRIDVQDADADRFEPDTWWAWVATIAVCATLVGRRRWPLRTLALGLVLTLPLELAGQRDTVAFFALVITFYSVAAYSPPKFAVRGIAMTAMFYAVLVIADVIALSTVPVLGPLFLAELANSAMGNERSNRPPRRSKPPNLTPPMNAFGWPRNSTTSSPTR
jgi:hypothetical protein